MEKKQNAAVEARPSIVINRTFNLPLSKVWKAWSEPESFKKWWGPKDYSCPSCTIDFKVGGKVLASMKGPDGKEIWSVGTYREIVPNRKIVVTDNFSDSKGNVISGDEAGVPGNFADEMLITVQFEEVGGKTRMILRHDGISEEMQNDCVHGWQESLDKLESL